jgi:CHAT domain-containing protein
MSACDSATATIHPGDEILSLAGALLALGTVSLVGAVLEVPDEPTARLMLAHHRRLDGGESPAAALAAAQHELALDGSPADRAAAAGFVCFGAG